MTRRPSKLARVAVPCLRAKDSVDFAVIAPGGFRILAALDAATTLLGRDLVITAGTDSHPQPSAHNRGEAYDVRVSDMPEGTILALLDFLRLRLGANFTVLYEAPTRPTGLLANQTSVNPAATAPHLHLQVRKGVAWPT